MLVHVTLDTGESQCVAVVSENFDPLARFERREAHGIALKNQRVAASQEAGFLESAHHLLLAARDASTKLQTDLSGSLSMRENTHFRIVFGDEP